MVQDEVLEKIKHDLVTLYECHTVILYGSRARGDFTDASDYDVAGIRAVGEGFRDARLWSGVYLDIFVHNEKDLETLHPGLLDMRFGKVLVDDGKFASDFFSRLSALEARGPALLRADEIQALRTWHQKALDRIRIGGIQGDLRRMELVPALLEHFFTIRGEWYRGPKAAFKWLQENRPALYQAFEGAFKPEASIASLEGLVALAGVEFDRDAKPVVKAVSTGGAEVLSGAAQSSTSREET